MTFKKNQTIEFRTTGRGGPGEYQPGKVIGMTETGFVEIKTPEGKTKRTRPANVKVAA